MDTQKEFKKMAWELYTYFTDSISSLEEAQWASEHYLYEALFPDLDQSWDCIVSDFFSRVWPTHPGIGERTSYFDWGDTESRKEMMQKYISIAD